MAGMEDGMLEGEVGTRAPGSRCRGNNFNNFILLISGGLIVSGRVKGRELAEKNTRGDTMV